MNKVLSYVAGAIAIVALIVAVNAPQKTGKIGPQGPQGPRGEQGIAGKDGVTTVVTKTVTEPAKLGAFPGGDFQNVITVGGVPLLGNSANMRNATNTPCSFLVTATTSLNAFLFQVGSTTAQATIWDLATSTSPNATTSLITQFTTNTTNLAANKFGSFEWSNDQQQIGNISPGTYVNLGVRGVTGGSPGGTCKMLGIQF